MQQRSGGGQGRLRAAVRSGQPHPLRRQVMTEAVVADQLFGGLQHGVRLVGAVEGPEEVPRPGQGDGRSFRVVLSLRRQAGEQRIGLEAAS